ncbi:unnamed protein product [Bursaphelenchus xylophilus]|uniref:(pine wood nematode) hypothetical protein n=1 Tax=Bursaphelenchus xylophilus TaxID=6326 RepID=A0A1I7RU99_BURXY|nr:unnamed protein product [Bursaphelenchus xylophilus]CAG9113965.1 unnamed protein product [Bursaphelenchus xylophilus]
MADPQVQEVTSNEDFNKPGLDPEVPDEEESENIGSTVKSDDQDENKAKDDSPKPAETNGAGGTEPKENAESVKAEENEETPAPQPYDGPPRKGNKRRRKTKAARALMGVGKMLEQYRQLKTEHGDLDVDEDETGRFQIGGSELSFESWSQINKTQDEGIVRADFVPPSQKWKKRSVSPIEWKHLGKVNPSTSNGHNKKKGKGGDDKDEGEISDSDDQSDDTISSDSDDDAPRHHKKRRRPAPKPEPTPQGAMPLSKLFTTAYKFREVVVQNFTIKEKMAFLEAIRQI